MPKNGLHIIQDVYSSIPYVAHEIQKLAATEQSTKHVDIHTIWLLALKNTTNTAMAHKTAECKTQCGVCWKH